MDDPDLIQKRLDLLSKFKEALETFEETGASMPEPGLPYIATDATCENARRREEAKRFINRNLVAAKHAAGGVGRSPLMTTRDAPMAGRRSHVVDMFDNVFIDFDDVSLIPYLEDHLEQVIGAYEAMLADPSLVPPLGADALDIEGAVIRALRPSFKDPPTGEKEVQDAVANILRAVGVEFTREQDTAPVGPHAFKPDFVVGSMDLAIEVKWLGPKTSVSDIQEQLAADVVGYRTRWKRLLVVVYDLGRISDPEHFKRENMKRFGVAVVVVKH
jgi:hypothetical protein